MRLAYLYSRYPVLSQTFCDTEMLELERRGVELVIASMYPPKTTVRHEYLSRLRAPVHYAPEKPALERLVKEAKQAGRWPETLIEHRSRVFPGIAVLDILLAGSLLAGALALSAHDHDAIAAIFVSLAAVMLAALSLIESATTAAAGLTPPAAAKEEREKGKGKREKG